MSSVHAPGVAPSTEHIWDGLALSVSMANIWDDLQLSKSWSNVCHPINLPYAGRRDVGTRSAVVVEGENSGLCLPYIVLRRFALIS